MLANVQFEAPQRRGQGGFLEECEVPGQAYSISTHARMLAETEPWLGAYNCDLLQL